MISGYIPPPQDQDEDLYKRQIDFSVWQASFSKSEKQTISINTVNQTEDDG